ncbi:MAG: tagaturonate epimerase family protein, partial [Bacteroidota bacterium]|nr:tagaturonate epimerase family protein [Bacteroidota bacterium]
MNLTKYSIGIGDRFAHQALAQLRAVEDALKYGAEITPVWNKSYREHKTIGSEPEETRLQADNAVKILKWDRSYFVDADHINMENVELFIEHSDFFTIDVVDFIGTVVSEEKQESFFSWSEAYLGELKIPGIATAYKITIPFIIELAEKYLGAAEEALKIYDHIARVKGKANFVTEVSMDEVEVAQSPIELFFILGMLRNITLQTFAPKFTGEFLKGIDYVGDLKQFEKEFDEVLFVLDYAKEEFDLPRELKLSIHTGSDKFRLYPIINMLMKKHDQGIHLKTAGTTWLEELNGLSISGEYGLSMAKDIYAQAFNRFNELSGPY